MAKRKTEKRSARVKGTAALGVSATADELLLAALESGGDPSKTGRFLMTFKEGAGDAAMKSLKARSGFRVASARDFNNQAMDFSQTGDAEAVVFPEIGVALVSSHAAAARGMTADNLVAEDSPVQSVDPEYFMFATQINPGDYLRGVLSAAQAIYADLGEHPGAAVPGDVAAEVFGVTWGLNACRVPPSHFDGNGIKVAVLDTGFDLGHPEFAGRLFTTNTFVGQPVQDLHGQGTHTAGTATGPKTPAGVI